MFTIDNPSESEISEDLTLKEPYLIENHNCDIIKDTYPFNKFSYYEYNINNIRCPSIKEIKDIFIISNNIKKEEDIIDTKNKSMLIPSTSSCLNIFNVINHKKRGKPPKKQIKFHHLSTNFDNLQRKIQVHFLTFVINLSNDVLKKELGIKTHSNFKQIDYKLKRLINHNNVKILHTMTIKELLKMEISPKNKNHSKYINIITLNKVCKDSKFLDKFFDIKYLEFFNRFYYSEDKKIDKIHFEGKEIILSKNTKSFYNLIQKYPGQKDLLIDTAKSVYFYGYDSLIGNNSFKTMNKEKIIINLKE